MVDAYQFLAQVFCPVVNILHELRGHLLNLVLAFGRAVLFLPFGQGFRRANYVLQFAAFHRLLLRSF